MAEGVSPVSCIGYSPRYESGSLDSAEKNAENDDKHLIALIFFLWLSFCEIKSNFSAFCLEILINSAIYKVEICSHCETHIHKQLILL